MKKPLTSSQFWSAFLGNLFEHYDTALFGFLSPFLAPLFFPKQDPITALVLTFAMIPIGMLARPLGSLFFGRIGDFYGRSRALSLSLFGMGLVSGWIALCPTYDQAGLFAALFLCLGRMLQNFFAGGEIMGGAIFLLENATEKKHDLLSGVFSASTMAGILLASGAVALLSFFKCLESGWRWLYAIGAATAFFGCNFRKDLYGSPQKNIPSHRDSLNILWMHRKSLFIIMLTAGFSYANYSIALVLMNGFVPLITSHTKADMMALNTALLIFDLCALPLCGWLCSKTDRNRYMLAIIAAIAILGMPLFYALEGASLLTVVFIRILIVFLGIAFTAPLHALWQSMTAPAERYLLISFGYAVGSQLIGGPTTAFSLWIFKKSGNAALCSFYWVALALFLGAALLKRSNQFAHAALNAKGKK